MTHIQLAQASEDVLARALRAEKNAGTKKKWAPKRG